MNLLDVNVWVSLTLQVHPHYLPAKQWLAQLGPQEQLSFCRQTQLGLLRVLTLQTIPGTLGLTQAEAWILYEAFLADPRVTFTDEPDGLQEIFRRLSFRDEVSPKRWADDYLAAFALSANLTLVTFDSALAARVPSSILLRP